MIPRVTNLLPAPSGHGEEKISVQLQMPHLRLEHIVSRGQASPRGFWYNQMDPEWVALLRGTATLDFGEDGFLDLNAGDSLTIPAHQKHRVEKVSEDAAWVAVHFRDTPAG
jgi:cupin 2 domain-containing protein